MANERHAVVIFPFRTLQCVRKEALYGLNLYGNLLRLFYLREYNAVMTCVSITGSGGSLRNTYIGSQAWNTYANVLQQATINERSVERMLVRQRSWAKRKFKHTFVVVAIQLICPREDQTG